MEHTPLPWIILGPRSDGKRFIKREGYTHAIAIATTNYDLHGFNAAFIVRAANNHYQLLEALEASLPLMQRWTDEGYYGDVESSRQWLVDARAVIKAAKGDA
ncbi:MAG: hypothetical protein V3W37_08705 [Candidatus Binatia bacterium]